MPADLPDNMPEDMLDRMPDGMPEDLPDNMPEDMPDRMLDGMPEDMPEHMPEDMPEDMPDRMPDRMPENMSDRMPEDLPVTKCINVMVGITRSKVIVFVYVFSPAGALFLAILLVHIQGPWTAHNACLTPKRPEKCTVHRFFHGVH